MTDDYTHRTLLANERTYLAWWRTGLTALTVALAAALALVLRAPFLVVVAVAVAVTAGVRALG